MKFQVLLMAVLCGIGAESQVVGHHPALLQHADGRFFALNAHLEPGQLFHTPDGRIFTLATSTAASSQPIVSSPLATSTSTVVQQAPQQQPASTGAAIVDVRDSPVADNSNNLDDIITSDNLADPATFVTRTPATAVTTPASTTRVVTSPAIQSAQPLVTGTRFVGGLGSPFANVVFRGPAPAPAGLPLTVAAAGLPLVHQQPHTVVSHSGVGSRHLLADSNTGVFRGFFFYPNAGINFDF